MTDKTLRLCALLAALTLWACGGTQPKSPQAGPDGPTERAESDPDREAEPPDEEMLVASASSQLQEWIGQELAGRILERGPALGKQVAADIAADKAVLSGASGLARRLLKSKSVRPRIARVEDQATSGLSNKLTLGWKALRSGGIDAYKKRVIGNAERVGVATATAWLRTEVLTDPRLAELLGVFVPALRLNAKVSALSVQENLSPEVSKRLLGIALRLVTSGSDRDLALTVRDWIAGCRGQVGPRVDRLLDDLAALESLRAAAGELAIEVISHPLTEKELLAAFERLLGDKAVHDRLVAVYTAAAFDKGDAAIEEAIDSALALPVVEEELFSTLTRLAAAPGATPMIESRLAAVTEDPELSAAVERFLVDLLSSCGDPTRTDAHSE